MIFQTEPIKCIWAGWETDTYKLQRCGWNISSAESQFDRAVSVAIEHPDLGVRGVSDYIDIHRLRGMDAAVSLDHRLEYLRSRGLVFGMQLAHQVQVHVMGGPVPQYYPIDATPTIVEEKWMDLHNIAYFQPLPKPVEVVPPSFDEIMQMALDHQAPKQKELREKARKQMREPMIIRAVA